MSISSHAICDHCERKLVPLEAESIAEDYLFDSGWVCVKWSEGDEEDRMDETRDFCSFDCASRWCAVAVNGAESYGPPPPPPPETRQPPV